MVYLLAFILFFKTCYIHLKNCDSNRHWVFMEAVGRKCTPIHYFYAVWRNCYDSHLTTFDKYNSQFALRFKLFYIAVKLW
jgi:hypothetical protein